MSTAAQIITAAFREGNFIAVGETPTAEEIAEALPRLQNLIDSLFGVEIGESYRDFFIPSEFVVAAPLRSPLSPASSTTATAADLWKYPPPNSRMIVKATSAYTLQLPANPSDGARLMFLNIGSAAVNITLNGNGHLIENAASLTDTVANLHSRKWFYRADLGDWVRIEALADETANMPLPVEFDDYFICGLAIRFAPRFQVSIAEETASRFNDVRKRLKSRYRQSEGMPVSFNELQSTVHQATSWDL